MMAAYITANPTLLRRHFPYVPPSLNSDTPFSYFDLRAETVHHANGLRDRNLRPMVVIVDRLTDNGETLARFDVLEDSLLDHFTTYPHIITGSIWSDISVSDESIADGDSTFPILRFTFEDFAKTEGRT